MHGTVETVICLVTAPDILNVTAVGLRPVVILHPTRRDIPPRHLDDRYESLGVQIFNLPVHELEIVRVDAVHVRKNLSVTGHFAGEKERAAAFVIHVFRAPLIARFVMAISAWST